MELSTLIGPADVADILEAVVARNVALVRDVSAQAQARISDSVFRGLTNRTPAREVAKELREGVSMSRRRSINIASDQLTKPTSTLDGGAHASSRHRKVEVDALGQEAPTRGAQDAEWQRLHLQRSPADMPGELPFCGCRKLAVVELY